MKYFSIILLVIILGSCNGQNKKPVEKNVKINNLGQQSSPSEPTGADEGVVYFSSDNGMTWINASKGLPQKVSIGLGGIAASPILLGLATKENGVYIFDFNDNVWVNIPSDPEMINSNIGAMVFFQNNIYVGTQYGGVFFSNDRGISWTSLNSGLGNLTIRKLSEIDGRLYAGTNHGLYSYHEALKKWELEYGESAMQVNGITGSNETIFIATNLGAFKYEKFYKKWEKILDGMALLNISYLDKDLYAMTYNELLLSSDRGERWHSIQRGLPRDLYTFNVIENDNTVFAGQWDGVYHKTTSDKDWKFSGKGLPIKFAVTNLKAFNGLLVISTSERKLRTGMTTEK